MNIAGDKNAMALSFANPKDLVEVRSHLYAIIGLYFVKKCARCKRWK
jgi:hypothetical protein